MKKKRFLLATLLCLAAWLTGVGFYHTHKALPEGVNYRSAMHSVPEEQIDVVYDLRWVDGSGALHHEQHIFDTLFALIEEAERYILVDKFLFNSYGGRDDKFHRDLSSQLTSLLVAKKKASPGIAIDFITDPINTVYGGSVSKEIEQLEEAGVNVIVTRLDDLHDSNFLYSVFWRTFLQWFGNSEEGGWLMHPFSPQAEKITLRSYLRLLNFKANHRKIAIVDSGDEMATMVSSANPHGGSSLHSNIALVVRGPIWISVYEAETAVAKMSGGRLSDFSVPPVRPSRPGSAGVRILTENQIKDVLLERIESASSGDAIRIAQFYLADRNIIDGLAAASGEGVDIKLVLDPNKDAFGYEKIGIPNRQAGHELVRRSNQRIELRWYDTHGEQFHTKLFMHESGGTMNVILGSANLTRRNLDNFNLELDVELTIDAASDTARAFIDYFERIWTNKGGRYTLSKESFEDDSQLKRVLYRIQEWFGLSTF